MEHLCRQSIRSVLLPVSLIILFSPAQALSIEPSHPRLSFTATDLPTLRNRVTTTHVAQWQVLLSWKQSDANNYATQSGRNAKNTHRYIERNAFMYLMLAESNPTQADQRAQVAKNWLMELASYEFTTLPNDAFEFIWVLALGYDWLYNWPGLSEADKQQIRAQLIEHTDIHVSKTGLDGFLALPTGPDTSKSIYDNMSTENNMVNAFAGLALWEDADPYGTNATAQTYLDVTYARFQEIFAAMNAHAANGGYWEGPGYYGAQLQGQLYFAYVWKIATGEDLFASNQHLQNAGYYFLYALRPDGVFSREGDQTCLPIGCARSRFLAEILADVYQDEYVQWFAEFRGARSGGDWHDIVYYNASLQAQPPTSLPLYRHFDFGRVVIRTGWDIGPNSDDTYFAFNIHDWVSGHTQVDVNSFTLFRKGPLAIDSGRYGGSGSTGKEHERNYAIRTVAHNTITVHKPGEDFGGFANDGGQEFLFRESEADDPRLVADLNDGTRFDTATLQAFIVGPDYYVLKGNATDAYHSTGFNAPSDGAEAKISNFTRELAFFPDVPDPVLVVFDRISSPNANWPKKWLLHSIDEPSVNGAVIQTEVPNHITYLDGDVVTISRDGGRLFSQTVLPTAANVRKIGGSGYEFWVDDPGQNYPMASNTTWDVEAGAWRVEIEPTQPSQDDFFLHVLSVTNTSVASVPPAALIDATEMYGAEVGNRVVLFSKTGNLVNAVSYAVSGVTVHLVTSLASGSYHVTQGGTPVPGSPFSVTGQNILSFTAVGGGSFAVFQNGATVPLSVTVSEPAGAVTLTEGGSQALSGSASIGPKPHAERFVKNWIV